MIIECANAEKQTQKKAEETTHKAQIKHDIQVKFFDGSFIGLIHMKG